MQEYQIVESMIQPQSRTRRRTASSSNGQGPKSGGAHQFLKPSAPAATVIPHSEVDDISDDDVQMIDPGMAVRTTAQVVIHQPYKGTGNLRLTRAKPNGGVRSTPTAASKYTGTASPYFNHGDRRSSTESMSEKASTLPQRKHISNQQIENPPKVNGTVAGSKRPRNSDLDLDELSHEVPASPDSNTGEAMHLLRKSTQTNGSSNGAKNKDPHSVDDDYSEDEHKKADMVTTSLPKKRKLTNVPGEGRFDVIQIFSERTPWLIPGQSKPWYIVQNCAAGVLTVVDDKGGDVKDLKLAPTSITQLHRNIVDGKILLVKAADQTAKKASKICLELGNCGQSEDLVNNFKMFFPSISSPVKEPLVVSFR